MTVKTTISNGDLGQDVRDTLNNALSNITTNTTNIGTNSTAISTLSSTVTGPSTISVKTAAYTLVAADNGTIIRVDVTTGVAITLPNNLPAGFSVVIVQTNTAQATMSAATGASMVNRQGFTKTAGQNAVLSLLVITNPDNASAKYILTGDGA